MATQVILNVTNVTFVQLNQMLFFVRLELYNLGYGKQAENVTKHDNTFLVTDGDKLEKKLRSPFFKDSTEVYDETDDLAGYMVKMQKSKIDDSKPVHVGVAILQWSKVLFINFMYWLEQHLEEGAFKTCYADTDSMALALTKSGVDDKDPEKSLRALFDPIVKPSMKQSWEETWKSWFVTTDEIWDIRKPGKLKGMMCDIIYMVQWFK